LGWLPRVLPLKINHLQQFRKIRGKICGKQHFGLPRNFAAIIAPTFAATIVVTLVVTLAASIETKIIATFATCFTVNIIATLTMSITTTL
jgi:hypothetical protein